MRNCPQEIVDFAGIAVASMQVGSLPCHPVDAVSNVGADDVATENLVEGQVRIVDAYQDHSGVGGAVNNNLVIESRHRDLSARPGEENVAENVAAVSQLTNSDCPSPNVEWNISVGCESSRADFNRNPIQRVESLELRCCVHKKEGADENYVQLSRRNNKFLNLNYLRCSFAVMKSVMAAM